MCCLCRGPCSGHAAFLSDELQREISIHDMKTKRSSIDIDGFEYTNSGGDGSNKYSVQIHAASKYGRKSHSGRGSYQSSESFRHHATKLLQDSASIPDLEETKRVMEENAVDVILRDLTLEDIERQANERIKNLSEVIRTVKQLRHNDQSVSRIHESNHATQPIMGSIAASLSEYSSMDDVMAVQTNSEGGFTLSSDKVARTESDQSLDDIMAIRTNSSGGFTVQASSLTSSRHSGLSFDRLSWERAHGKGRTSVPDQEPGTRQPTFISMTSPDQRLSSDSSENYADLIEKYSGKEINWVTGGQVELLPGLNYTPLGVDFGYPGQMLDNRSDNIPGVNDDITDHAPAAPLPKTPTFAEVHAMIECRNKRFHQYVEEPEDVWSICAVIKSPPRLRDIPKRSSYTSGATSRSAKEQIAPMLAALGAHRSVVGVVPPAKKMGKGKEKGKMKRKALLKEDKKGVMGGFFSKIARF